jgi:Zn-dependent membrane protease YugP
VLELAGLINAALMLYAGVLVFQVITLPVEFDASARARALLQDGYLGAQELEGANSVLNAAALTYLASTLVTFLQFLRLIALSRNRR